MTKFDSRLRQQCSKLKFQMDDVVEVLGLSLFPYRKKKQTLLAGTSKGRLPLISLWHLAVFVGTGTRVTPVPPATRFKKGEDRRKKKRKVLHLLRCYTHTHTRTCMYIYIYIIIYHSFELWESSWRCQPQTRLNALNARHMWHGHSLKTHRAPSSAEPTPVLVRSAGFWKQSEYNHMLSTCKHVSITISYNIAIHQLEAACASVEEMKAEGFRTLSCSYNARVNNQQWDL